jgi:hypothetical protein
MSWLPQCPVVVDVAYGHAKWWEAGTGLVVASYSVCSFVAPAVRVDEARAKAESERLLKIDQQLAQELQAEEDTEGRAARMRCMTSHLTLSQFAYVCTSKCMSAVAEWNLVSEAYESCVCALPQRCPLVQAVWRHWRLRLLEVRPLSPAVPCSQVPTEFDHTSCFPRLLCLPSRFAVDSPEVLRVPGRWIPSLQALGPRRLPQLLHPRLHLRLHLRLLLRLRLPHQVRLPEFPATQPHPLRFLQQ